MPDFNQLISKIQNQTLQAGQNFPSGLASNTSFLGGNASLVTPIQDKLAFDEITPYKNNTVYDNLSDGSRVAKFENYIPGTDNNERLAQQQTTTEKWGNGLAKLGIKTGTAVIGGTLGVLDSLGTLMTTGSLSEAYNSKLNVWLDDVNKVVDYKLPNLYTEQDRNAGLFGQMGQANFYADKVFGGLSFMAGAVISEAIWAAATVATFGGTAEILALNTAKQAEKAASWATKAFGTETKLEKVLSAAKSWVKKPSTSVLDEAGEVAMRGLSNREKQATILAYKFGKGADIIIPMMRSAGYESGMESRLYMNQTETAWLDKYRDVNGKEPSPEEYTNFKDKLTDSANLVFGANMAILSLSNYAQLKNTILGKTTEKTITNSAWSNALFGKGFTKNIEEGTLEAIKATKAQKIFGRVYGLGKGFVIEGQEEMSQSVISGTGENYMMAGFDKDNTKSTYGIADSFTKALKKTYGTTEGLTEGLIGGLIGILGGVGQGIGNKKRGESFSEIDNEREAISKAVDYSNEYTQKSLLNNIVASNKMMMAEKFNDDAKRNNDIPGQKLAEDSMRILRIQRDSQIGGAEEGMKDYAREVKAMDTDYLKEELGFTTLEEVNNYKEKLILDHEEIAKSYAKNLAYAESLLGEKDSKIEEFKNVGIRTIHAAMAHSLTLGESARRTDNNLTGVINDEILNLSGNESFVEANNVQQVLESISEKNKTKLNTLNTEKTNLKQRLKTQEASLVKEGKFKVGEDASTRQNRLIEATQEIQKTQEAITQNNQQSEIALKGLGIEQYTNGVITVDSFNKQAENVKNFEVFMKDLSKSNPQKYSKMLGLLAQKSKSIKHIKNYEQAIDLIVNKATRLKTVEGWAKKTNLKTKPAEYYAGILNDLSETTINIVENNRQAIENREAFKNKEEVSQNYIDRLKEQDYNTLLQADQEILDEYDNREGVGIEMPNKIEELEKERDTKIAEINKEQYFKQESNTAFDSIQKRQEESINAVKEIVDRGETKQDFRPITKEDRNNKVDFEGLFNNISKVLSGEIKSSKEEANILLKQYLKEIHPDKFQDEGKKLIAGIFSTAMIEVGKKGNSDKLDELYAKYKEINSKYGNAVETEEITPNTEEINRLEKERDDKVFQASKPDLKLKLVSSKDLVNSKDPIGNKEIQDTIKEKLKNLKQLIECL